MTRVAGESRPRLGFSLNSVGILPFDEALCQCSEIGYDDVEFVLSPGHPTEPGQLSPKARRDLRSRLDQLHLGISALMLELTLPVDGRAHAQNLEAVAKGAQLAHELVPDNPPMLETVLGGKPADWVEGKERMAERLRSWADTAEAANIKLAIKAHFGMSVSTPDQLLWLLRKVNSPALWVNYDYSHFKPLGISLAQSLAALMPYTRLVHVKDSRGDARGVQFLLPGEGDTDYVSFFRRLKRLDYHGPVVALVSIQIFKRPGYNPRTAEEICYRVLSAARKEADL